MARGKLIVIEGACDGIGKTTQLKLLKERLEKEGKSVVAYHFPSDHTEQGKLVENYLKGKYGLSQELSPYFINSLYAIDRAITWEKELKKPFNEGSIILLDRYTTSSLIYQSAFLDDPTKQNFIDYVCDFEYNKLKLPKPDQVIFLKAPFEVIESLRQKRKENEGTLDDIHEMNASFMKKVYENALQLSFSLNFDEVKCNCGNQMKSKKEIHEEIYQLLKENEKTNR